MIRKRGQPPKIDRQLVIGALKKHKSGIILPNKRIISKLDPIWGVIAKVLDDKLTTGTLHAMACRADIRAEITGQKSEEPDTCDQKDVTANDSVESLNESGEHPGTMIFSIEVTKSEFDELCEERVYRRREASRGKEYQRRCTILTPGVWQEWITSKLWETTRLKCAFNFRNCKITQDGSSGAFNGACDCGGQIVCRIDNSVDAGHMMRINCTVKRGEGKCGKRYLRAPIRQKIGEELITKSATIYRTEKANEMMRPGDPEPPHLYKKSALINAKYEYLSSQYLHRDPIQALQILKLQSLQNSIHGIGMDPFYVHYWTNHQLHVYRAYAKQEPASISIDATGSIVKPIERCDGSKSKHIYLYHCVVNNRDGQFSVSQMISEKHTTVAISFWLAVWVSQAGFHPKEVVCDSSKALLGAAIKAFTGHATIEEYSNACSNSELPPCFVRIDVAHFIKMYADFLKDSPRRVKIFYLAVMGQFIQSRDINSAGAILKSLLVVARCETDGNLATGQQTQCEIHRLRLRNMINPCLEIVDHNSTSGADHLSEAESIFDDQQSDNYWSSWASAIDLEAKNISQIEEGDHDNAQYLPRLANRILSDIKWFPLWSSVCRDQFQYGRVPATSAAVESEFNIIKTHLLRNDPKPIRADVFVQKHLAYIDGRLKVIDAQTLHSANDDVDTAVASPTDQHILKITPIADCADPGVTPITNTSDASVIDRNSIDEMPIVGSKLHETIISMDISDTGSVDHNILDGSAVIDCSGNISCQSSDSFSREFPPLKTVNMISGDRKEQPSEHKMISAPQALSEKNKRTCTLCFEPLEELPNFVSENTGELCMLCVDCAKLGNAPKIIASRETEDWGGQSSAEAKTKSRYLKKNHATFDAISCDKMAKIPIMKNGNSVKMKASKIGKAMYSFLKTCAFDSVMQMILVAAHDHPNVRESVNSLKSKNRIMNLVMDIMDHGLRAQSYRLRANILIEIFKPERSIGNSYLVDCQVNVCYLVSRIFDETPSVQEISTCTNVECEERLNQLRTICVPRVILTDNCAFEDVLKTHVALKARPCPTKKCSGVVTTRFSATGPFIMIETDDDSKLELCRIPKSFRDPLDENARFHLIGIVDFKPPNVQTRRSDEKITDETLAIGHYTPIVLRPPEVWMEFNDLHEKSNRVPAKYKAIPHLIIYFKK